MMEAARTSETSVNNYFTRQYIPEDNSELQSLNKLQANTEPGQRARSLEDVVQIWARADNMG
jgi:hypothetical protein